MTALILNPAQRKEQRALAHHLDPVVLVGGDGLTPAVLKEAELALASHGLIKVRVFNDDRALRETFLQQLASDLDAAPIQHSGKLLVLWRPMADTPRAAPREDRQAGPRVVKLLTVAGSANQRPQVRKVTILGNQRVTAGGLIKRGKKRSTTSVKKRQS